MESGGWALGVTMSVWIDASGRRWWISITVAKIQAAKQYTGFDLLTCLDGELSVLEENPIDLAAVMTVICERQIRLARISNEDFERGIVSEAIESAASSLILGLMNFCPDPPIKTKDTEKEEPPKEAPETTPLSTKAWKIIHELAGIIGVDPEPRSWRELDWMAKAKRRHDWRQTSMIITTIANAHRDTKKRKRPYHPNDFMPADLAESIKRMAGFRLTPQNLHVLKPIFSKN